MQLVFQARDEAVLRHIGAKLACASFTPLIIFLQGELGAGKTTLVGGFLQGLGYQGTAKSPTFTLVEEYELSDCHLYHFDLYRLQQPEELESIGIQDYFTPEAIALIEWPQRALELLPNPDLICQIDTAAVGRTVKIIAASTLGDEILVKLRPTLSEYLV